MGPANSRNLHPLKIILILGSVLSLSLLLSWAGTATLRNPEPAATAHFGGVSLRIEYADTFEERAKGLSGRKSIPEDYGMLFVFPNDDLYSFWMKDMLVPIDIFWLDSKGHVISMVLEVSPDTYPESFKPSAPARYVLETAAGFARMQGIATGTPLLLQNIPTVSQ